MSESKPMESPPRRDFLKYVATGVGCLAIGAIGGYLVGSGNVTTVTETKTQVSTVTKTVTGTTTTTTPGGYPTTQEGLAKLIQEAADRYFGLLKDEAKKASVDWRQFEGQVKSLNCSMRQGPDNDIYARMAQVFEEISGIHINLEFTPEVQQREKVSVDILSKTGVYHLPMIDNMHLVKYVKSGGMEGLNKYIEDPKLTDKNFYKPEDFYEMVRTAAGAPPFGEPGDMYAVPSIFHHTMQYYRKDVFDANGLTVNDIDTFDALMQTAAKLNKPSEGFYGFSSRGMRGEGMNIFTWQTFHRGFGGRWFDENWKPVFNEQETIDAIQFYVDLMTKYGPPGVENYDFSATLSSAGEGRVAIGLDCDCWGTLLWNPANAKPPAIGNIFSYRVPRGKGGRHAGFFFWSFGVPAGIKSEVEKKATWLWCSFAHSPYGIAAIQAASFLILPSRKSVWDMPGFIDLMPPNDYMKYKIISQTEDSHYDDRPMIPEWPEVGDIAGIALSSALAKERTAKEAADWAQGEIYKIMEKAGYYS